MQKKIGLIVGVVLFVIFLFFILTNLGASMEEIASGPMIMLAFVFIGIALFGAVVIDLIFTMLVDPKKLIKPVIGIVVLAVLFFIGYSMADTAVSASAQSRGLTGLEVGLIEGALITTFILVVIAIIAILVGAVNSLISKT